MTDLLTVAEAAERIRASKSLIQHKCQDGTIPAIRVGRSYRIAAADLDRWTRHDPTRDSRAPLPVRESVSTHIETWYHYMKAVKNYSPDTFITHQKHIRNYVRRLVSRGRPCSRIEDLFDRQSMMIVLMTMEGKSYFSKLNTFCAVMTFGRFLVEGRVISPNLLDPLKPLKPRQQAEPRRTHLKANQVRQLFDMVYARPCDHREKVTLAAAIGCMVYAGLRANEVSKLAIGDVDMDNGVITVRLGKGGKTRRVGISNALRPFLTSYLEGRPKGGGAFFILPDGTPYHRNKLGKRMKSISKRMGVDITCHGLRRTFATLAAGQGRSLNAIRIALGHSKLETTQLYLLTSEAEVIEAMKGW